MKRFIVGFFLLLLVASSARAQDVVAELSKHLGKEVDLRSEPALRDRLVAEGLIPETKLALEVTPGFLEQAIGVQRFYNHVDATRYHAGDRILVKESGSGGTYSPRAEIAEVLPDGTYKVNVWDKPVVENPSTVWGHIDVFTGKPSSGGSTFKIEVTKPDGSVVEKKSATPWLVRSNEREVTMTQEQVDALNGKVSPAAPYDVNGWKIDPANDFVLRERLEKAKKTVDRLMPASELVLPQDPAARRAKLDEISKLQEKVLGEVFADNFIEHPGNNAKANDRMSAVIAEHPELSRKIGAVLLSQCGVCTDQAAAMVAILNEIGPRMGLTARAIGGSTIRENAGHGFVDLRFANGAIGMYDVTWHFQGDRTPVDNMDFATWEGVSSSNRKIDWISQETTDKTSFVDRTSERARDLYRGYTNADGETLLAGKAAEIATRERISLADATRRVLGDNKGSERIGGELDPESIVRRAGSLGDVHGTPPASLSSGFLERMSGLRDQIEGRVHAAIEGASAEER